VNGIELSEWTRHRPQKDARIALGLPADRLTIGAVGRLSGSKALDRLLRLVRDLLDADVPPFQVLLLGEGPEREKLQAMSVELNLDDAVQFMGWQTELQKWYEAFDLVVMTSIREGLPNTLLEAMAMEVASASTPVGGVRDLYDDGRCGVILEGDDPSAWAMQIAELLRNAERRGELARMGREQIEAEFSFAARMEKIVELYDRLMGKSPRSQKQ
jgi:glycosyltransferase involved in cell wall biosynthesis